MNPTAYFDQFATRYQPYKAGAWCYEDGCIYRGLQLLYEATGEDRWVDHLTRLVSAQVSSKGLLAGYDPKEYNIDNILSGRVLFPLSALTGETRYTAAAEHLIGQLKDHPRIRTGNYWHKRRYPHQVWLDGLYMALPFQIEYALATGHASLIADALQQFDSALTLTVDRGGLYVHGYDESREQRWADGDTGKSPAAWARAIGWLAMALIDALVILPASADSSALREKTVALLNEIAARQTPSGLWEQVLDAPQLEGNYEESSATAMFAYALMRAARLHLATGPTAEQFAAAGKRALSALVETRLAESEGMIRFTGICQVAGLGSIGGPYRDGTPHYYLTEPVVCDDAKGVGPLMMAYAEAVRTNGSVF